MKQYLQITNTLNQQNNKFVNKTNCSKQHTTTIGVNNKF